MPATRPFWDPQTQPATLMGSRTPGDPLYGLLGAARGSLASVAGIDAGRQEASRQDAVQQLLDKQAIAEVLYRRARADDRSDVELAHGCYHPGATERHEAFDGLASEFIDVVSPMRQRPSSPVKGMMHFIANILCEFDAANQAFVESYHVTWCQRTDGTDTTIVGRRLDKFEKRDGRWAIVHRDVIFDSRRMDRETGKYWDRYPTAKFLRGQPGDKDPLYRYISRGV